MAVISISYDEGNKKELGYKSVNLSYNNIKDKKSFNSGDFVKDWYDCLKFLIIKNIVDDEPLIHSSSVDHFIMDGAKFDSAYLHTKKEETVLKYTSNTLNTIYLDYDICEDGIEFFVPEGTKPTWEEHRELCGDKKLEKK